MTSPSNFKKPAAVNTDDQQTQRKVGFELEFTCLDLEQTAAVVERVFSGRRTAVTSAACSVEVAALGDFSVELDWDFLKRKTAQQNGGKRSDWLDLLSQAATLLVPVEIVCPPIPLDQLHRLDPLITELRRAGAVGTEDSLFAAYGVHINAEVPKLEAACLFDYLRAFALLQWWLAKTHQVDVARRLSPYIDFYPEAYLRRLFSQKAPDLDQLTSDYLLFNPSRNRALDLLPLLAFLDPDKVKKTVSDLKINPRPAFHYRLPNCQIDKSDWSLAVPWNSWWVVEELAQRPTDLDDLARQFLSMERLLIGVSRNDWTEWIDRWLRDHALV